MSEKHREREEFGRPQTCVRALATGGSALVVGWPGMDVGIVALTGLAVSHEVFPSWCWDLGVWHGLEERLVRRVDCVVGIISDVETVPCRY